MSKTKVKVRVKQITSFGPSKVVGFEGVSRDPDLGKGKKKSENTVFSEQIPTVDFTLQINRGAPQENFFEVEQEYYLEFEKAPAKAKPQLVKK